MNRNTELHFAELPSVEIGRSKFDRSHTKWGTMNASELVPTYVDCTIMPGDTVKMRTSELVRMMTPVAPVMDDCFMDTYFFFVPYRLIWDDFKKFMGENETAPWTQTNEYTVPQIKTDYDETNHANNMIKQGSLADYMGYPIFEANAETPESTALTPEYVKYEASVLPFRAYCLIWNEFFRDENLQNPVHIYKDSTDRYTYSANDEDPVTHEELGGVAPLKVCKVPDYFTMCLPQPQKGPAVSLPMNGTAPIKTKSFEGEYQGVKYDYGNDWPNDNLYINHSSGVDTSKIGKVGSITGTSNIDFTIGTINAASGELYADLASATGATINALRQAFAIQKFYERQARGGTRYIEMVKSHFGVTNPDFRMQRPEYLGGHRTLLNMNQVVQTTPMTMQNVRSYVGDTGAYSLTLNQEEDLFTHSFTEHGILMGLCCIRQKHSYSQGLNRQFSMKKLTDFYFPEFANLGEQAVLNKEIFVSGNNKDNEAFGYQEAWAHYRYYPDQAVNNMRPNINLSLGEYWTYGDIYTGRPALGDTWIEETKNNINRTLYTQQDDQFMFNMYFGAVYTRPMPLYSIPGLIDHH